MVAIPTLISTVQQFFSCKADYFDDPADAFLRLYGIDILCNPSRGAYIIESSVALILGRILSGGKLVSAVGLRLHKGQFDSLGGLLNSFERSLAWAMSHAAQQRFRDVPLGFGSELTIRTIDNFCGRPYSRNLLPIAVNEIDRISRLTFEGRPFTTGLIVTRSSHAFEDPARTVESRGGTLVTLRRKFHLRYETSLKRRFWYLADGRSSFFLCDHLLRIAHIFLLEAAGFSGTTFEPEWLATRVRGADLVLRVDGPGEYTVTSSKGLEFIFQEGSWRARSFDELRHVFASEGLSLHIAIALGDLVFELCRRKQSALLVIPRNLKALLRTFATRNRLVGSGNQMGIEDSKCREVLLRVLSSDGATVFDRSGRLLYYGCIVDLASRASTGVRGTGETAALAMAEHGLTLKVSQDGTAKALVDSGKKTVLL